MDEDQDLEMQMTTRSTHVNRAMRETRQNEDDFEESTGYSLRQVSKRPARFENDGYSDEETKKSPKKRRGRRPKGEKVVKVDDYYDEESDFKPRLPKPGRGRPKKENTTTVYISNKMLSAENGISSDAMPRRHARSQSGTDLSSSLKENLRRLKNVLKLPKARRWVYCEFFYSGVDRQLFLGDSEFSQCLREAFPNLKCRHLCRPEWRTIRRLIGKPRRCSQAFFVEERMALAAKRAKIRRIYEGVLVSMTTDMAELPSRLPRPLNVGAKIYARVRAPKDGIYAGTINAVLRDEYMVVFDKHEMIPAMNIKDCEVMTESRDELASLGYFLEQNRASMPTAMMKLGPASQFLSPNKILGVGNDSKSPLLKQHDPMVGSGHKPGSGVTSRRQTGVRDEKMGNFPVRMLVILVKLSKLIEMKRSLVKELTDLNAQAERMNLLADRYPYAFQEKYAQVAIDLETLNKQLDTFLTAINEYNAMLLPHLSEVTVTARPEALRKLCHTHAVQIVKHCNNGLNVQSRKALQLITALTALLLQVRSLGQQKCTQFDLHTLAESLTDIHNQVASSNAAAFQDHVEIHMKQIHNMMLSNGGA